MDHGLKSEKGFLLGSKISVADIATMALWGTLIHSFPTLKIDLDENAPQIARLCERVEERPRIKKFLKNQRERFQYRYCGGEIEKSLRKIII